MYSVFMSSYDFRMCPYVIIRYSLLSNVFLFCPIFGHGFVCVHIRFLCAQTGDVWFPEFSYSVFCVPTTFQFVPIVFASCPMVVYYRSYVFLNCSNVLLWRACDCPMCAIISYVFLQWAYSFPRHSYAFRFVSFVCSPMFSMSALCVPIEIQCFPMGPM